MAKHILRLSVGAFGLVLLVAGGWLWSSRRGPATVASISPPTGAASPSAAPPAEPPAASRFWPALLIREYPQISLQGKTREQALEEAYRRNRADRAAEWKVKMAFYGLVVDESFRPVEGADVHFQWTDASARGHAVAKAKSDAQGRFQLTGQHGKVLSVYVRKAGYYVTPASRARGFEFANPAEEIYYEPDPGQPVLFRLRKMGAKVNLIVKEQQQTSPGQGDLRVECWTDNAHPDENHRYDWHCRVTVPGGGLVLRTGEFSFEAPENGYQNYDEINMPKSSPDWNSFARRQYFLHLANGSFARIEFEMIAAGDHFFSMTSFLNPTSGDRNLEVGEGAQGNVFAP